MQIVLSEFFFALGCSSSALLCSSAQRRFSERQSPDRQTPGSPWSSFGLSEQIVQTAEKNDDDDGDEHTFKKVKQSLQKLSRVGIYKLFYGAYVSFVFLVRAGSPASCRRVQRKTE